MFLYLVIFLCPSLLWVFYSTTGFGLMGSLLVFPSSWLISRLLSLSLLLLLLFVSGYFCPFLLLFICPLSFSLGIFGYLFQGLFLLLFLSNFPLSFLVLLLLPCKFFSPYTLVFPLLCTHYICLVLFYSGLWLLLFILQIFYFLLSCGIPCSRGKRPLDSCALFLPVEVLCSLYRVSCCFCRIFWGAKTGGTFYIKLVSLFFIRSWMLSPPTIIYESRISL